MRRKQTGPELKLFELDTLKYLTENNIKDSIYYIAIFPERMSPADVTFARKSGLLDSSANTFHLSKIALHYLLKVIDFSEYAFLILTKQWIKTTNVNGLPTVYNEPLLTFLLQEIQNSGYIPVNTFTQVFDDIFKSKYAPIPLSNIDSLRYVKGLLLASQLVINDGVRLVLNPLATALINDIIDNKTKFIPPSQDEEESYWNSMTNGIFNIIDVDNKKLYSSFYPHLIR